MQYLSYICSNRNLKLRLIFPIVVLVLLILSEIYIFQAVKTAFGDQSFWAKWFTFFTYILLSIVFYTIIGFTIVKGRGG